MCHPPTRYGSAEASSCLPYFLAAAATDCGANAAAPPFSWDPTACRNAPTVVWGCFDRSRRTRAPPARPNRRSGCPGKPVTGQFARKVGQHLVNGLATVSEGFFDDFD